MAASRPSVHNYCRPWAIGRGFVIVAGSFAPNGASALSATGQTGQGFTVARTSAGLFTLTLDEKYKNLVSADATLQLTTGDDKFAQIGAVSLSARTVAIRVWDVSGAAETDVAAAAGNRINFVLVLQRSSMVPVR